MRLRTLVALLVCFALLFPLLHYLVTGTTLVALAPGKPKGFVSHVTLTNFNTKKSYEWKGPIYFGEATGFKDIHETQDASDWKLDPCAEVSFVFDAPARRATLIVPGDVENPLTLPSREDIASFCLSERFPDFLSKTLGVTGNPRTLFSGFLLEKAKDFGNAVTFLTVVDLPVRLDIHFFGQTGRETPWFPSLGITVAWVFESLPAEWFSFYKQMGVAVTEPTLVGLFTPESLATTYSARQLEGLWQPFLEQLQKAFQTVGERVNLNALMYVRGFYWGGSWASLAPVPPATADVGFSLLGGPRFQIDTYYGYFGLRIEDSLVRKIARRDALTLSFTISRRPIDDDYQKLKHDYVRVELNFPVVFATRATFSISSLSEDQLADWTALLCKTLGVDGALERLRQHLENAERYIPEPYRSKLRAAEEDARKTLEKVREELEYLTNLARTAPAQVAAEAESRLRQQLREALESSRVVEVIREFSVGSVTSSVDIENLSESERLARFGPPVKTLRVSLPEWSLPPPALAERIRMEGGTVPSPVELDLELPEPITPVIKPFITTYHIDVPQGSAPNPVYEAPKPGLTPGRYLLDVLVGLCLAGVAVAVAWVAGRR